MAPITIPKPPPKKPKGSKAAAHRKSTTHTALGVSKHRKKENPRARAEMLKQLEKTLPTLNTVVPADAKKKGVGKQKKTFVQDGDKEMLARIVESVASGVEKGVESRLEKARRLEAIREARRKEDEAREAEKSKKKEEAKQKVKKGKKGDNADEKSEAPKGKKGKGKHGGPKAVGGQMGGPGKKRVSFA